MKCPRCQTAISATPDATGTLVCPGCGVRLRTRAAAAAAAAGLPPAPPAPAPPLPVAPPAPTPQPTPAPAPTPPPPAITTAPQAAAGRAPASAPDPVLEELRAVRRTVDEILRLVSRRPSPVAAVAGDSDDPPGFDDPPPRPMPRSAPPPVRARRRKTVLLIDDDDEETQRPLLAALKHAEVPTRVVSEGNEGLAAIASDKPDVIVLELAIGGSMGGKDVVNMIKATMEWVDIPIILYTRLPVESQKEARTIHGADDFVLKGPGSAEELVSRVIASFRRG